MRKRKNLCCLCVATILAIIIFALHPLVGFAFEDTSATQPVLYSFISIDIPNSSGDLGFTGLTDINDDGEITGGFTNSSGFSFLLGETFRLTDIQCPGDISRSTVPRSINKHGEIAGFCGVGNSIHGFFRSKRGKYTLLDFPGAILTEAVGINDDGQVVGDYRIGEKFHGFFWDAGLFLTIDVPFSEATGTGPQGINNVGQIVGFYNDNSRTHGFLYDRGNFISIDFPGAQQTSLTDINDHGQIVGQYFADDMSQSFLLDNGRFTTINVPFSDVVFTQVFGINNRGQIVGRYLQNNPGNPVNPFSNHGFIATPQSEPESKSQLLVSKPHDSSNFKRWAQNAEELDYQFGKGRLLLP